MGATPWHPSGDATGARRLGTAVDRPWIVVLSRGGSLLGLDPDAEPIEADEALPTRRRPLVLRHPAGCGSTAAVLVAAHWIQWREPTASVAFCAADHAILLGPSAASHHRTAGSFVARDPRWLVLLSVRRTSAMERGWIETGEALHEAGGEPLWRVRGFRLSRDAGATGPTRQCVWDASAFVARASALVAVGRALHPELCEMISDIVPRGGSVGDSEPLQRAVGAFPPSEALDDLVPHFLPRVAIARLPGPGADLAGTGEGPWSAPPNRRSSASASPLAVVTMPVRERGRWFGE